MKSRACAIRRSPETRFHLLGVTRTNHISTFRRFGVVSFDSTSPLRQAFKDEKDNYYTLDGTYSAVRVPQVDGNKLKKRIRAGEIDQNLALELERTCLESLRRYDYPQGLSEGILRVRGFFDKEVPDGSCPDFLGPGTRAVLMSRGHVRPQPHSWAAALQDIGLSLQRFRASRDPDRTRANFIRDVLLWWCELGLGG